MRICSELLGVLLLLGSCVNRQINSEKDYYQWINEESHHLFVTKSINGVKLTVKYLSPEYLAYKEYNGTGAGSKAKDSLLLLYNRNRTFLLSFNADGKSEGQSGDIMYKDITNTEEFNNRLLELTFNIGQFIRLKTDSNIYLPVLFTFENSYGISPGRSIYLVFAPDGKETDDLLSSARVDIVFDDQVFMTGISHFSFKKDDLDNIPHINFWEK